MTSTLITFLASLGFLSAVLLLATSLCFLYALKELRELVLEIRSYLPAEKEGGKPTLVEKARKKLFSSSPPEPDKTFVKMQEMWNDDREGRD